MVSFTTDKDWLASLDDKEKLRIIACLLSVKGELSELKIDWSAAATRFGAASSESMRVNSRKALDKIKVGEIPTPSKPKKADVEGENDEESLTTDKKGKATKRKANGENAETAPKKSRKKSAKSVGKVNGEETGT